jgi:NAD(P)H-dependent FMN reductase
MPNPHILILNGSVRGRHGNSGALAHYASGFLVNQLHASVSVITLTEPKPDVQEVYNLLTACDGFFVISGVYWDNFGSSLQQFVEVMTAFENSPAFWGKPVCCALSADSVGGQEVAARIHAVFAGLGCWSPPCASLVLSRVGLEAIAASQGKEEDPNEDVWRLEDMDVVLQNLVTATALRNEAWVCWPHVTTKVQAGPWPENGPLQVNTPKFL